VEKRERERERERVPPKELRRNEKREERRERGKRGSVIPIKEDEHGE
jgi:hypothetical protein